MTTSNEFGRIKNGKTRRDERQGRWENGNDGPKTEKQRIDEIRVDRAQSSGLDD